MCGFFYNCMVLMTKEKLIFYSMAKTIPTWKKYLFLTVYPKKIKPINETDQSITEKFENQNPNLFSGELW